MQYYSVVLVVITLVLLLRILTLLLQPRYIGENLRYTFTSVAHWGELANGDWTLSVADRAAGQAGAITGWTLRVYGDAQIADNLYV